MENNYKIENMYTGSYSSIDPNKSYFSGYRVPISQLSTSTNPQNAAIAKEFSDKLNLGLKNIEVEALIPKTFDAMPKDQLQEVRRLAKLANVKVSMHGPVIEPSGLGREGLNESERKAMENQVFQSLQRAHEMNPEAIKVTFHTSNALPSEDIRKEGDKIVQDSILVVNTDSGRFQKMPLTKKYFPGEKEGPEEEIKNQNQQTWESQLQQIGHYSGLAKDYLNREVLGKMIKDGKETLGKEILPNEKESDFNFTRGATFVDNSYRELKDLFDLAYRKALESNNIQNKEILDNFSKKIEKKVSEIDPNERPIDTVSLKQEIIEEGLQTLRKLPEIPKLIGRADEFMMEKSAQTFGNAAFKAYKEFKEEAPIIVIENPPANQQFGRGEDVAKIVQKSRDVFVNNAVQNGISKSEAEKKAEQLIGATLDVGHLNMLRQKGFTENDIVKEAEKFKPVLKHIHLSDNFGMEHTELPMGMGNVPFKQIMEKLGKKGYEVDKVIEAGDWWTQHTTKGAGTPIGPSLEGLSSPVYSGGTGIYWNQTQGLTQGYFGGFGTMLPQTNYNMFGAGFSQLPPELGGNLQQGGSRITGRSME